MKNYAKWTLTKSRSCDKYAVLFSELNYGNVSTKKSGINANKMKPSWERLKLKRLKAVNV